MAKPPRLQNIRRITSFADDALIALDNLQDSATNLFSPTIRLGVTGLSRAGKTVFITSLVHNLIHGGRLPLFEAYSSGRIAKAELQPQPSMDMPRFQYEDHVRTLIEERQWPNSTRTISELRLTIHYESASGWNRTFGRGTLNIDIVDYPGEWLLDLPLLGMTFAEWSEQAISLSQVGERKRLSEEWLAFAATLDGNAPANETDARRLAELFTAYLRACREDRTALSTLPPGRFLMPGDLDGSPALTFAPFMLPEGSEHVKGSLHAMLEQRFQAYKDVVIKPFFREHFARLDRQIVLVDALQAINAGPDALADLEIALAEVLACFKPGSGSWLGSLVSRRIDRILFAATKADHMHHDNHDRLERLLERLVESAAKRARFSGAKVDVLALAAIRATREAIVREGGEELPVILGTPLKGEVIGGRKFDGETETAIFPGDLPEHPERLFDGNPQNDDPLEIEFVRFRPPGLEKSAGGASLSLPHIRLDRALEFLFGDYLF